MDRLIKIQEKILNVQLNLMGTTRVDSNTQQRTSKIVYVFNKIGLDSKSIN